MDFEEVFKAIEQSGNLLYELLDQCKASDKKVFLFGAGNCGYIFKKLLERERYPIAGIIDNFAERLDGVPVLRLDEVLRKNCLEECVFIISAPRSQSEIRGQLLRFVSPGQVYLFSTTRSFGPGNDPQSTKSYLLRHKRDISEIYNLLADEQSKTVMRHMLLGHVTGDYDCFAEVRTGDFYYPPDLIAFREGEVMVELGSNNGETLLDFIARCPKFGRAYCFEADAACVRQLRQLTEEYGERVRIIDKIAWNEHAWVGFQCEDCSGGSHVDRTSNAAKIEAVAVDDVIPEDITYMKMDIEGSELRALHGAKAQIIRNKPVLAVSVYHKNEDIVEIPRYIRSLRPDYRLYLRHHGWDDSDTVLYAI